jgi:hypothetical protein
MTKSSIATYALAFVLWGYAGAVCSAQPSLPPSIPPPTVPGSADLNKLASELTAAMADDKEKDSLSLAVQILKAAPLRDMRNATTQSGDFPDETTLEFRANALKAFKEYSALDEYEQKVRAHYKGDTGSLIFDKTMAESLLLHDPDAALPFLLAVRKLDPKDGQVIHWLADYYLSRHDEPALVNLIMSAMDNHANVDWPEIPDCLGDFERSDKLDWLTHEVIGHMWSQPGVLATQAWGPFGLVGPDLDKFLTDHGRIDDLITLVKARADGYSSGHDPADRMRLIQLLQQKGDKDGVGEECEYAIFGDPSQQASPNGFSEQTDAWSRPIADYVRTAAAAGQLDRLKNHAKANLASHPDSWYAESTLAAVLVYGHDPEAAKFLPTYLNDGVANPSKAAAFYTVPAIYGELTRWPEMKALLSPTLAATYTLEAVNYPNLFWIATGDARLALEAGDPELAQKMLHDTLVAEGKLPPPFLIPGMAPPPQPMHYQVDDWAALAQVLVEANMPDELALVVPMIADPSKAEMGASNFSRFELLTQIGESALDAGLVPSAKLCAGSALHALSDGWEDPKTNMNEMNSQNIYEPAILGLGNLFLQLGETDQFDALHALVATPTAIKTGVDNKKIADDLDALRPSSNPVLAALTPVVWLDRAPGDTGAGTAVAWDFDATPDISDGAGGWDGTNNSAPSNGPFTRSFFVGARDLAALDGKIALQIAAGPTPSDWRIVATVPKASSRGTVQVNLKPDDRYVRAIGQIGDDQPRLFTGPIIPICPAENLMPASFHLDETPFANPSGAASLLIPMPTYHHDGGPVKGGSYDTITPAGLVDQPPTMEVEGTPQKIIPGATYVLSGWLKGSGGLGVRRFDGKGQRIMDSPDTSAYCRGQEWHFIEQTFTPEGTTLVPYLDVEVRGTLKYHGLYLGVLKQPASPPREEHEVLATGFKDSTLLVENPAGGLLAIGQHDGQVRCFDIATRKEVGTAARATSTLVGVDFYHDGASTNLVATDAAGEVLVRPAQSAGSARVIYRAPWPIATMAVAAKAPRLVLADADQQKVIVIDLSTGLEIVRIEMKPGVNNNCFVFSADGTRLYRWAYPVPNLWDTISGNTVSLNPTDLADIVNLLKPPHAIAVGAGLNSPYTFSYTEPELVYTVFRTTNVIQKFHTGKLAAYCLSNQNDDAFAIDPGGTLTRWKFPSGIKISAHRYFAA